MFWPTDYPEDVLARFDFVVAGVHSRFKLDRKTRTERIIRAVENPTPPSSVYEADIEQIHVPSMVLPLRSTPTRGGSISTGAGTPVRWTSGAR
jgi:hypothetical protein